MRTDILHELCPMSIDMALVVAAATASRVVVAAVSIAVAVPMSIVIPSRT